MSLLKPAVISALLVVLLACSEQAPSRETEETVVRAQSSKLASLISSRDAAGIAELYAEDGTFMPPNSQEISGRDGVTAAWQAMFQMPGFSYQLTSNKVVMGTSADLASDVGQYEYKSGTGGTQVADRGKSIVNWVKRDGQWKILAHAYSSNAPMLPSTPTVPADALAPTPDAAPGTTPMTPPATDGTTPATPAPSTPSSPTPTLPSSPPTPSPSGTPTTPPASSPTTPN